MPIDALSVLCAQLTRDLLAIAKFLFETPCSSEACNDRYVEEAMSCRWSCVRHSCSAEWLLCAKLQHTTQRRGVSDKGDSDVI